VADEHKEALDHIEALLKRLADVSEEARDLRRQIAEALRKAREGDRPATKPPSR